METIALKFDSKEQLFAFYSRLNDVHCSVDLRDYTLSSTFSQTDVLIAVKNFGAAAMHEERIY